MALDNPLETAVLKAAREGSCPVQELEDFYTNHWDFETLCSSFNCKECVVNPEDFGPMEPWVSDTDTSSDDIPF